MAENKKFDFGSLVTPTTVTVVVGGYVLLKLVGAFQEGGKKVGEAMEEVERSKRAIENWPEFSAGYFTTLPKGARYALMLTADAQKFVNDFANVKGLFNDNEVVMFTAMKNIKYRTQLAQVAQMFQKQKGFNLGSYLVDITNTNERRQLEDIYSRMASGILK